MPGLSCRSRVFRRALEAGRRTAPPMIELAHLAAATRAFEANTETTADLAYLLGRGTSLAGA
jgi:serine/threonine-protein kinase HipA